MSKKTTTWLLLLVCILVLTIALPNLKLTLFGFAKEVPIQFGYESAQDHWVITTVITESEAFKMVLRSGSSDSDGTNITETQRELQVAFQPAQPTSETNLLVTDIKYADHDGYAPNTKAPCYDVNDAGWLTTAAYHMWIGLGGVQMYDNWFYFNYKQERVVEIPIEGHTLVINNLGMLPQGVEVPSGDLVLVQDPLAEWHVFNKADFLNMVNQWNDWVALNVPWGNYHPWSNVWGWAENNGYLPQDVQMTHVSDFTVDSRLMDYIYLWYSGIVFAGVISLYVPSALVSTVTYSVNMPEAQIVNVTPNPIPALDEGTSTNLNVVVKNVGTAGSISVSLTSTYYSVQPLTMTQREFVEGEQFTFEFNVFALNVLEDTETSLDILAYGRGGSSTLTIKGTIIDVPGYTPPDVPANSFLKVTVVEAGTFKPVRDLLVSVTAGSLFGPKATDGSGVVQFDLGKFTGAALIQTGETDRYQKAQLAVGIAGGELNEATLMVKPHGFVDWSWLLYIGILGGVGVMVMAMYRKRRQLF